MTHDRPPPSGIDWPEVAAGVIDSATNAPHVARLAERLMEEPILEVRDPIPHDPGPGERLAASAMVVQGLDLALSDHLLTDREAEEVKHLIRLTRLEEGDVEHYQREGVETLISRELTRLLEDGRIDPNEAHLKTQIQELLGLSYDRFLEFAREVEELVILRLLADLPRLPGGAIRGGALYNFRRQVLDLDSLWDVAAFTRGVRPDPGGYLYILINQSMPGLMKIGKTRRTPETRASEVGAVTGVPTPFHVVFQCRVGDPAAAESWVHNELEVRGWRVAGNREFFSAPLEKAVRLLMEAKGLFR